MTSTVNIYKCSEYNKNKIIEILRSYFKNTDFAGKKILIKPNMLQAHAPEENVTTNPILLEAVTEYLISSGAECSIGDSPSGRGIANAREAARKTGFASVADKFGISFDYFDGQELKEVNITNGKIAHKIYLPATYFTYDMVINLPKLKTHALTVFTLGVKNMFGLISGVTKVDFHRKATHPKKFAKVIVDIYSAVKPDFTILDGIESMEGSGPVTGMTRQTNRIFISDDANALDATIVSLCGLKPQDSPITKEVFQRGLGEITDIEVIKDYTDPETEFKGFKIPAISRLGGILPVWFMQLLSPLLSHRPVVNNDLCILCKKCIEVCPVEAIDCNNNEIHFDTKKCIKCFCCAERCQESAIIEKSTLKLFNKDKKNV